MAKVKVSVYAANADTDADADNRARYDISSPDIRPGSLKMENVFKRKNNNFVCIYESQHLLVLRSQKQGAAESVRL